MARNTHSLQPVRWSVAPAVLGDITNMSSRNSGKVPIVETAKHAWAGCGACCQPSQPTLICGDSHNGSVGFGPSFSSAASTSSMTPSESMDVDELALIGSDPQSCAEYVPDIYRKLSRDEVNFVPRPDYMESQPDINTKMRSILVDWLVEVHVKYKMKPETLFLTVSILDRFLEKKHLTRKVLQLSGVASMLIAAKFEEIYPPEVKEFVSITDHAYTRDDILKMEMTILTTLNFVVSAPTIGHFLDRLKRLNQCGDTHNHLTQYLAELSLIDSKMLRYTPSHVAAAATLLSNKLLKRHPAWPATMVKHAKQTEPMIKGCAREICGLLEAAERNPLQAVRKKFSHAKFGSVGKMHF